MQKSGGGTGFGGGQASWIASEADREFISSSSSTRNRK